MYQASEKSNIASIIWGPLVGFIILGILFGIWFKCSCRREIQGSDNRYVLDDTNLNRHELTQVTVNQGSQRTNSAQNNWGFYVTVDKAERIVTCDLDKLCFVKECTIQSNQSLTGFTKPCYFEIEILDYKNDNQLMIGLAPFCDNIERLDRHFGFFNCKDRTIISAGGFTKALNLPVINNGDIIGCLYYPNSRNKIIYTLNGQNIIAIDALFNESDIYPTIHSSNNTFIRYNFGSQPFSYLTANLENFGLVTRNTIDILPPRYNEIN